MKQNQKKKPHKNTTGPNSPNKQLLLNTYIYTSLVCYRHFNKMACIFKIFLQFKDVKKKLKNCIKNKN